MNQCRLHKTKKHGTNSTLSALSLADSRQWGAAPPPRRWCQCLGAAAPWRRRWSGDCRSPAGALRLGALLDSRSFRVTGIGAVAGAASAQSPQCWSVSVTEQVPINTNFSPRCSQATLGAKFNKRCDRGEHTLNFEARPRSAGPGPESVLSSGGKQRSGELGLEGGLDFRSGFEPSGLDRPGPRAARQAAASTGTRTMRGWATETDIGLTQAV